ncbi:uncharacterized protein LOC144352409 [Saccoglossus kowalevskii]
MAPTRRLLPLIKMFLIGSVSLICVWLYTHSLYEVPKTITIDDVIAMREEANQAPVTTAETDQITLLANSEQVQEQLRPSAVLENEEEEEESVIDLMDQPVVVDTDLENQSPENIRIETDFVDMDLGESSRSSQEMSAEQYTFNGIDEGRIRQVLTKAANELNKIRSKYPQLGLDAAMFHAALVKEDSVDRLERVFTKALLTGQPLKIGVIGGSISAGACLPSKNYIFALVFGRLMQSILGTPVEVRRGAISACGSNYFTYCTPIHVKVQDKDIIFLEHAANDNWKLGSTYAQERLLRSLLTLSNQPQLMYINFLLGPQMKPNLCFNAELKELTPLSEHYSIPAISLRNAICPTHIDRFKELFAKDGIHPSVVSHEIVAAVMLELFTKVLINVGNNLLRSLNNGDQSFMAALQPSFAMNPAQLPTKLWPETHDVLSQRCWSTLQPISDKSGALKPAYAPGWSFYVPAKRASDGLSVRSSWYTTKAQQIMAFPVIIDQVQWNGSFNCNVTLFMFTCPECGTVQATLYQEDSEIDTIVANSQDEFVGRLRTATMGGIMPGNYTLSMMTREMKQFKLVAIATHCDIP